MECELHIVPEPVAVAMSRVAVHVLVASVGAGTPRHYELCLEFYGDNLKRTFDDDRGVFITH